MNKIERAIVNDVIMRHDLPEEIAVRMVRSVIEYGPGSVYFDVVAPSATDVIRPLWDVVKKTITAWAPLLAEETENQPERRKCYAAESNGTIGDRPQDSVMICPMSGNVTDQAITCEWCGQTSLTRGTGS